jgi:hypothetical protein
LLKHLNKILNLNLNKLLTKRKKYYVKKTNCHNINNIWPGTKVVVYDPWAKGNKGYLNNQGEFKSGIVLKRYGKICPFIEKHYGREAAKYPDLIDVLFDCGRISKGHFTNSIKCLINENNIN